MVSKLQQLRESRGLTQARLCEKSGISVSSISKIESGSSAYKTHVGVALALADTLGCDVHDLFEPEELSHIGRPPHTGKPIGYDPEPKPSRQMLCPDCFTLVPADIGCEICGVAAIPVT